MCNTYYIASCLFICQYWVQQMRMNCIYSMGDTLTHLVLSAVAGARTPSSAACTAPMWRNVHEAHRSQRWRICNTNSLDNNFVDGCFGSLSIRRNKQITRTTNQPKREDTLPTGQQVTLFSGINMKEYILDERIPVCELPMQYHVNEGTWKLSHARDMQKLHSEHTQSI